MNSFLAPHVTYSVASCMLDLFVVTVRKMVAPVFFFIVLSNQQFGSHSKKDYQDLNTLQRH